MSRLRIRCAGLDYTLYTREAILYVFAKEFNAVD